MRIVSATLLAITYFLSSPAHASTNFVTIVLDDLSMLEFNRETMPRTFRHIVDKGVSFTNMTVTTSLCGPSRSGIHTGKFAHNHGFIVCEDEASGTLKGLWDTYVRNGNLPHESGPRFKALGYYTAMLGKYTSGYGDPDIMESLSLPLTYRPDGWDMWAALMTDGVFYANWQVNENGTVRRETRFPSDYLATKAVEAIDAAIANRKPFFINVWPQNPHGSVDQIYPDRLAASFANKTVPQEADFFSDPSGRHPSLSVLKPAVPAKIDVVNQKYRDRLRSTRAADEMVGVIVDKLIATHTINSTVIIFTSDNGFMLGHYRLVGKMAPYFRSVNVPLAIRAPQVPPAVRREIVQQIDILPTQLELAGAPVTSDIDGQSLAPLLTATGPVPWRRWGLVESWSTAVLPWLPTSSMRYTYRSLVGPNWKYIHWDDGFEEFYQQDRLELVNRASQLTEAQRQVLRARVNQRFSCIGESCRERFGASQSEPAAIVLPNRSTFDQSMHSPERHRR